MRQKMKDGHALAEAIEDGKNKNWDSLEPAAPVVAGSGKDGALTPADIITKEGLQIKYKEERREWLADKKQYMDNRHNAASKIQSDYCTVEMQNRLKTHPECQNFRHDPVAMLPIIRDLMRSPVRSVCPFATLTNAFARLINAKQNEDEENLECIRKMKENKDTLKTMASKELPG